MEESKLIRKWRTASNEMGFKIEAPFELRIGTNDLKVDILVKDFSGEKGKLVVARYETIKPYLDEIDRLGYGYSVISETNNRNELTNARGA